jgi:DNA-binding NarL/FixJ family response regulator
VLRQAICEAAEGAHKRDICVPGASAETRRRRGLGGARLPSRLQPGTPANPAGLTDRQLEILRLVATGPSNAEIADRLVVSPRTVDHHVSAALQKIGVRTRRDAAAWAAGLD